MNNGWIGNIEAGYGTDDRYKANFNFNRSGTANRLTILGSANNINDPGAADGASGRFRLVFGGSNGINTLAAPWVYKLPISATKRYPDSAAMCFTATLTAILSTSSERCSIFFLPTLHDTAQQQAPPKTAAITSRGDSAYNGKPDSFKHVRIPAPTSRPTTMIHGSVDSSSTFAGGQGRG